MGLEVYSPPSVGIMEKKWKLLFRAKGLGLGIEYGVYGDLMITYSKPYFIYLRRDYGVMRINPLVSVGEPFSLLEIGMSITAGVGVSDLFRLAHANLNHL